MADSQYELETRDGERVVRSNRRLCPHCKSYLSLKTFRAHKRLYYSEKTKSWEAPGAAPSSSEGEESPPCSDIELGHLSPAFNESSEPEMDASVQPGGYRSDSDSSSIQLSDPSDIEEDWNDDDEVQQGVNDMGDSDPEDEIECVGVSPQAKVLVKWLTLFLLQLQSRYKLPESAVSCLFSFLFTFFCILGSMNSFCRDLAKVFPRSLYNAKSNYGTKLKFIQFVACRRCFNIYQMRDCTDGTGTRPKRCSYIEFPSHPQHRMRQACNTPLLKTVEFTSGKRVLYPFLTYCYLSLCESLKARFGRKGFSDMCEEWRSRRAQPNTYTDVFDGNVWRDFQYYDGKRFLRDHYNLAIMINMDFFQPYKHVQYSVGAIYCVILNLPRAVRYKQENVILLGLIPGPSEPDRHINSFLQPLVNELLTLWDGVDFLFDSNCKHKVRCALLCVACDQPAARKTCGFLSHSANLGCFKCLKTFPGEVGKKDYSGFDRENWTRRTMQKHKQDSFSLLQCQTKSERNKKESELGCRYSVLQQLPYFDAPRFVIVDPMHNLYIGTAKHIVKDVWLDQNILSERDFAVIQERVDSVSAPADIGRVPRKIRSGFASFTADQWKNWVNYFSLLCAGDFLQGEHLECWRHFVLASRLLSCKELTYTNLQVLDALLLRFCNRVERLYGKCSITPNMHMHAHLKSCIEDYGPSHAFWLFAFERYNGVLGSYPNNNRNIEVQLMNRFINDELSINTPLPSEFEDRFKAYFSLTTLVGSNAETIQPVDSSTTQLTPDSRSVSLPSFRTRYVLTELQRSQLTQLYSKLYPNSAISELPSICWKYGTIEMGGKRYGSSKSRSKASSVVMAMWKTDLLGQPVATALQALNEIVRPAKINSFLHHRVFQDGQFIDILLVHLSWFAYHPQCASKGKPVTIWCPDVFETDNMIPIHFIKTRCVSFVSVTTTSESLLHVIPCTD